MSRTKNFSREEVLDKAIPEFWKKGFANTALQDLEKATGVNKSGLYSEFKGKDDIYVESLNRYLTTRGAAEILMKAPLGWNNLETFLKHVFVCMEGQGGCFAVSSMRELPIVPEEAKDLINKTMTQLKKTIALNIEAEKTKMDSTSIAELFFTFYLGISLEQNLKTTKSASAKKIENFMKALKGL